MRVWKLEIAKKMEMGDQEAKKRLVEHFSCAPAL